MISDFKNFYIYILFLKINNWYNFPSVKGYMWWNWLWLLCWLKPEEQTWVSALTFSLLYTVCRLLLRESNSKWTQGQRSRKLPCNEALVMYPPTQVKYDEECIYDTCICNCIKIITMIVLPIAMIEVFFYVNSLVWIMNIGNNWIFRDHVTLHVNFLYSKTPNLNHITT